ncbi:MAG: NAD(P)-dependent oxidoreductase [Jiangellaceae bacterium]|nr:NAD(P)-dependent oxidoreductase [Jiangellaceae bacterium]
MAVSAGLAGRGHDVVRLDRVSSDRVRSVDVGDTAALTPLLHGCDAVVHLAGNPHETSLVEALDSHVRVTHGVLEAMCAAGVRRLVYASSNHAVGFTPRNPVLRADTRPRPDTFYGVGKVAAEVLCSLYTDRFGIAAACLRIGSFADRPRTRRDLSTWLSPGDAVRLVDACLTAPDLEFTVLYGISANTRGWWDLEPARALGYRPIDDAEAFAAEILATPKSRDDRFAERYVGGEFCRPDRLGGR